MSFETPLQPRGTAIGGLPSTDSAVQPSLANDNSPTPAKALFTPLPRGAATVRAVTLAFPSFSKEEDGAARRIKPADAKMLVWEGTGAGTADGAARCCGFWRTLIRTVKRGQWTEQDTLMALDIHLADEARRIWESLPSDSFQEFHQAVSRAFLRDTTVDELKARVYGVQQGREEDIQNYVDRKTEAWRLISAMEVMTERELVTTVVMGLHSEWSQRNQAVAMAMSGVQDINALRDLLAKAQPVLCKVPVQEPARLPKPRGTGRQGGVAAAEQRAGGPTTGTPARDPPDLSSLTCWSCGQKGHRKNACPARSAAKGQGKVLGEEESGRSSSPKH